jgi:hypothetical protein
MVPIIVLASLLLRNFATTGQTHNCSSEWSQIHNDWSWILTRHDLFRRSLFHPQIYVVHVSMLSSSVSATPGDRPVTLWLPYVVVSSSSFPPPRAVHVISTAKPRWSARYLDRRLPDNYIDDVYSKVRIDGLLVFESIFNGRICNS